MQMLPSECTRLSEDCSLRKSLSTRIALYEDPSLRGSLSTRIALHEVHSLRGSLYTRFVLHESCSLWSLLSMRSESLLEKGPRCWVAVVNILKLNPTNRVNTCSSGTILVCRVCVLKQMFFWSHWVLLWQLFMKSLWHGLGDYWR